MPDPTNNGTTDTSGDKPSGTATPLEMPDEILIEDPSVDSTVEPDQPSEEMP